MASIAGPIAGGLAAGAAGSLFGGGADTSIDPKGIALAQRFRTPGFRNPISGGKSKLRRNQPLQDVLDEFRAAGLGAAGDIRGLLPRVRPGFGGLTEATRNVFQDRRRRLEERRDTTLGDLRSNLARRRVLGSSFAGDLQSQLEDEFLQAEGELANQEREALARNFLAELELTSNLLNQAADREITTLGGLIDQFNFEGDLAARLKGAATGAFSSLAQASARLSAAEAAGRGAFFEPAITGIQEGVSNFVSGLGGSTIPTLSGGTTTVSPFASPLDVGIAFGQ